MFVHSADTACLCGSEDVVVGYKEEATHTKEHYECDTCGRQWTERDLSGGLD